MKRLFIFTLVLIMLAAPGCAPESGPYMLDDLNPVIFGLTNDYRRNEGLEPLEYSGDAHEMAEKKVSEMLENGYFQHESPVSGSLEDQFLKFAGIELGKNAWAIGENLAFADGYGKNG